MRVSGSINIVRDLVKEWKSNGLTVGLVPTMGYLHEGHESLIRKAAEENDRVVVSVFVNPTQFGVNEDLDKYPKDLNKDIELCSRAGANLIFNPKNEEMYPNKFSTSINMIGLTEGLCGKSRPTHFSGVCTVVTKLFNIIPANKAYFGEKDAQQLAIIRRLTNDLNIDIDIVGCPIVRENDGLAKSSRNYYLSLEERKAALVLNKSLNRAKNIILSGEREVIKIIEAIKEIINSEPLAKIDYVEVVDSLSMKKVDKVEGDVLVAIAVYIGSTRLIDNFSFNAL